MIESIGIRLTELIAPIVPVNLSEAETSEYPYCAYTYAPEPVYTKDGLHHYISTPELEVVSDNFDEAFAIFNAIDAALQEIGPNFTYRLLSSETFCDEGVWTIHVNIQVNQNR